MQWLLVCFFLIAVICLIVGLRKSMVGKANGTWQHCSGCGWTAEQVQACQFEYKNTTKVAPLCFDCTLKLEAIPVRAPYGNVGYREAYA